MENIPILLFVGALIAVAVIGLVIAARIERKKREAFAAWADAHAFTYDPEQEEGLDDRYGFECLAQGNNRYGCHHLRGDWNGLPVHAFQYHYQVSSGSGKHRHTHHYWHTAVIVECGIPLEPLAIRPESLFDRLAEFVGWDDIDFESAEFSRRFHVSARDKRWAYAVLHPQAIEHLMGGWTESLELGGPCALGWYDGRYDPDALAPALDLVTGLIQRIPRWLAKEQDRSA